MRLTEPTCRSARRADRCFSPTCESRVTERALLSGYRAQSAGYLALVGGPRPGGWGRADY